MILFWIIINFLRNIYRRYIRWQWLLRLIKYLLNSSVNFYAALKRFDFPANYVWSQKLEMMRGQYEEETVHIIRQIIKPGMTVVDVGAHIGYYTRILAELVGAEGRVLAFEPEPENFSLLQKNTQKFANVSLFNLAVSNQKREMPFYTAEKTGAHSTFKSALRHKEIKVSAVRLDDWVSEYGHAMSVKIDFMKIDVEGGEPAVMDGALEIFEKNHDVKIVFEFNPENLRLAGADESDFLKKISSLDFKIFLIKADGLKKLTERQLNGLEPIAEPKGFVNLFGERPDKR